MVLQIKESDNGTKNELVEATKRTDKTFSNEAKREFNKWLTRVLRVAILNCMERSLDTGALAASGRIEKGLPDVSGFFGIAGGADGSSYEDSDIMNKSIVFGGMAVNPKTGKLVNYGEAVHDGHMTSKGGFVMGTFFMTDALTSMQPELDAALDRVAKIAEEAWSKGDRTSA